MSIKTKGYTFTTNAGEKTINGKSYWPHFLRLRIKRNRVLGIVRELLAWLESSDEDEVEIPLFGEMLRQVEDDCESPNAGPSASKGETNER